MQPSSRRIGLFGASGRTGLAVAHCAAAAAIPIVAFCRSSAAAAALPATAQIRMLQLDDNAAIQAGLDGVDSVVCVFGPRPPYNAIFCAAVTERIVAAMHARGLRRLVCLTGGMIGTYPEHWSFGTRLMVQFYRWRQPTLAADRAAQERLIVDSGLDWTIVKPPRLTDGAATGTFKAGEHVGMSLLSRIARADLATFLCQLSQSDAFVRQRVFIRS